MCAASPSRGSPAGCGARITGAAARSRRAVPLAPVLEPVGDLRDGQAGFLGQRALLVWRGVAVDLVGVLEPVPRLFLEAVDGLLAVPNRPGQGMLAAQPVLVNRTCQDTDKQGSVCAGSSYDI